jgi:G:T/U-mismatch repair DNA glycosylase
MEATKKVIYNKFKAHQTNTETEILILGTFTHDHPHSGDFFYGRPRNFLWHLLPLCFKHISLKDAPLSAKQTFMKKYSIDFIDVVQSLEVNEGDEENMDDDFIDSHIHDFTNLESVVQSLPQLKAIYFTRKTFNGIPQIKTQITKLSAYCQLNNIRLCKLDTPARHFSTQKQQQWIDTIVLQKTCLRV